MGWYFPSPIPPHFPWDSIPVASPSRRAILRTDPSRLPATPLSTRDAGVALAGLTADGRVLSRFLRSECINHAFVYDAPLPVSRLALKLADKAQAEVAKVVETQTSLERQLELIETHQREPPACKTRHFAMDREALRMVCSPQFWRMGVLWTLSLLYSYLLHFLRGRTTTPRRRRLGPHAAGDGSGGRPICVVTGATSGLGKAAAEALAREHYHVVLAGRSAQLLTETVQEIQRQQPDAYLEAFQVDLSSYKSIKKFETSLNQWIQDSNLDPSIQLLVNNAGMLAKSHRVTKDGLDEMMQTNYLGPFILTNILLPLLKNSPVPSRVVNLTSFTHRCVSKIDVSEALRGVKFGQWSMRRRYPLASNYEYTKFCLLMFTYELHRQLHMSSGVSVMAADPGVVETGIMRELPPCLSWFALFVLRFLNLLQQPDSGVGAVLDAALALPEASGKYFFGGKGRTIRSSLLSYDMEVAKKLWAQSSALLQELQHRDYELKTN